MRLPRLLRLLVAFVLVAVSALIAMGAPAGAAELADAGWWYVRPAFAGSPPTVPEGGLYVAGAPDGAVSIAAVRYTLTEDETEPKLTLKVAAAGEEEEEEEPEEDPLAPIIGAAPAPPAESQPIVLACQTGSGWSGEEAGSADAAPKVACGSGSVQGESLPDGTWTWDLAKLQVKTTVDVILVAGKVKDLPEGTNGSTFQLSFEKPDNESLETLEGAAPEPFVPPGASSSEFGGSPDLSEDAADSGFDTSDTGGGDVSFDPGDDTTSEGPALDEEQQALTPTAPLVQAQQPAPAAAAASASSDRDIRWLGVIVVLVAGMIAVAVNNQAVPALRGLGPFRKADPSAPTAVAPDGSPVITRGGLGRFARVRTGPAPRL